MMKSRWMSSAVTQWNPTDEMCPTQTGKNNYDDEGDCGRFSEALPGTNARAPAYTALRRGKSLHETYTFPDHVLFNLLRCDKHSPGCGPLWRTNRATFPALYKALVDAPDRVGRKEKRNSRARVLCTPTSVKRVHMGGS